MLYVYRVRRLVKIVSDETSNPTDALGNDNDMPSVQHCLFEFQRLNKKYTDQMARKMLAIATGRDYLGIGSTRKGGQTLHVKSEGLVLLTPSGYANAVGESIGKISPVVAVIIAIAALGVSIWSKLSK